MVSGDAEFHTDSESVECPLCAPCVQSCTRKIFFHQLTQLLVSVCAHICYDVHVFKDSSAELQTRMPLVTQRCRTMRIFTLILNLLRATLYGLWVQS